MTTTAAPTLSRRHAAGAPSARGLLFTVLGEFVLPAGGRLWTSTAIDVLGRLGVEEKATRQALMRTAADGWLASERVGRRTCWTLSPAGERLLVEGTERIYGFSATFEDWDGQWMVLLVRTPESDRPARHLLRTRLSWAGLGSPAAGVWVTPHADRLADVETALDAAGLRDEAQVFLGEHAGLGDPSALAAQAWDLTGVEQAYEDFLTRFRTPGRDPLAITVELVHAWRRFPWVDPLLPSPLLPSPWRGRTAARRFAELHTRFAPDARDEWQQLA